MYNLGPGLVKNVGIQLTPGQAFMLYHIDELEGCTVSNLSEILEVKPSAITVMLDRMVDHGYATRHRDPKDRRVVRVQITDTGRQMLSELTEARDRVIHSFLLSLSEEERETFLRHLELLASMSEHRDN